MPNLILIILVPLCIAGAIIALYSTFVLYRNWGRLGGEEISVSSIWRSIGIPTSGGIFNLNAAVRLFDDQIILKVYPTDPIAFLTGRFPSVSLQKIAKVVRKNNFTGIMMGPMLEIHVMGMRRYYKIWAKEATLDRLTKYFSDHNIHVSG